MLPNDFKQCNDTECWCNQMEVSTGHVTSKVLEPLPPHTNPAHHDMFSMFLTVGTKNEVFVMYQETHQPEDPTESPSVTKLTLYHTPTGERIEITIDPKWNNNPAFCRERAEAREKRHEFIH